MKADRFTHKNLLSINYKLFSVFTPFNEKCSICNKYYNEVLYNKYDLVLSTRYFICWECEINEL